MDELLNPEIDKRLVPHVCVIRVRFSRGSAFDIAALRLDGKRKFKSTRLAKMLAGRMFVTSGLHA